MPFFTPNPYPDMMIDIETLSTRPNAAIISIAAIPFNAIKGIYSPDQFYVEIDGNLYPNDFHIDPKTVAWWERQPIARPTGNEIPNNPLQRFQEYLIQQTPIYLWANSPSFDLVILKEAFWFYEIPWPHDFWNERDVRTIRTLGTTPKFKPTHNALQDCLLQIHAVCNTLKEIRQ